MILDESAIVKNGYSWGNITYVNDAFCHVTGLRKEEILGTKHSQFRHPNSEIATYNDLWSTLQRKEIWRGVLHCINPKQGSLY